ncbi:MAG TPA: hypothetical protein VGJ23_06085 [Gaiellaceae bacterium]
MLRRLRAAGIDAWVEGGWGVDALLSAQTRAHDDLDLGVRFEDVERICAALSEFERSNEEWPASFVLRDGKRKIDCHPLQFDERGDGWQANASGGAPHRWPREGLQASGRIDDVEVPCISPELQISWHVYPEFDDIDWQDVQRLCERFGLDVSPECRERPGFVAAKRGAPFTKRSSEESQRA